MATLKHISSKNSDYTAIEVYLIYQHDEFSGKVILDEQGRPMLRESYLLDTLECGDFSFATACLLANRKYGKNPQPRYSQWKFFSHPGSCPFCLTALLPWSVVLFCDKV